MVPPSWRYMQGITRSEHRLKTLAFEFHEFWKGTQIRTVEVHAALPILRMVTRPRIKAAEMFWMEKQNSFIATNLNEDVVLRVVMARGKSFRATKELTDLSLTPHRASQPVPSKSVNILHNLLATRNTKATNRLSWPSVISH